MIPNFEKVIPSSDLSFNYFIRRECEFPFNWHHHNEYELTAIYGGRGQRFVGDNIANYNGIDLVLLGPNLPHTWQSNRTRKPDVNRACVIQFDEYFMGEVLSNSPEFKAIRILMNKSNSGICFGGEIRHKIIDMMFGMVKERNFYKLLRLLEILETLGRCDEMEILSAKIFEKNLNNEQSNRIDKVFQYINKHYTDEINLSETAGSVHMSDSAFSRFFKRTTGKNFIDYVNELRINFACSMLIETDMNISEICFRSGFESVANFNRRFKEIKKMCPKEFRNKFLKRGGE
ncbi:MAG: HTH-type transcriptional regulator YesS [Planctomycetes bacterium ADurb.Bin401]|nr:MAG: HTH-type transcriptional regulator YesS [Planctomycetes bacterium ADurb.Bin401]